MNIPVNKTGIQTISSIQARLTLTLIIATICLAISAILLAGCANKTGHPSEADADAARIYGREQALRLAPSAITDSIEIEKALIDVRVRESALRNIGEQEIADCYIESFLTVLDSVNPTLHHEITGM